MSDLQGNTDPNPAAFARQRVHLARWGGQWADIFDPGALEHCTDQAKGARVIREPELVVRLDRIAITNLRILGLLAVGGPDAASFQAVIDRHQAALCAHARQKGTPLAAPVAIHDASEVARNAGRGQSRQDRPIGTGQIGTGPSDHEGAGRAGPLSGAGLMPPAGHVALAARCRTHPGVAV